MSTFFVLRYDFRAPGVSRTERQEIYARALEQAAYVEQHGFGGLMLSEHHASDDGYLPSPIPVASAMAAVTSSLPITISALLANLYDPVRLAEDIAVALNGLDARAPTIELQGVGVFDHGRAGSVWARVGPKEPLDALHRKIDRAIATCGLAPERRAFIPHITLGRWSRRAVPMEAWKDRFAGLASAAVRTPQFALYRSTLGAEGPTYDPVAFYPFRAG